LTGLIRFTILPALVISSYRTEEESVKSLRIGISLSFALLLHFLSGSDARGGYWQTTVIGHADPSSVWPRVSDGRVAWTEGIGTEAEVFVYENGVITQLTNNNLWERLIDVTEGHIAWSQYIPSESSDARVNLVLDGTTVAEGLKYDNASLSSAGLAWTTGSNLQFCDGSQTHTFAYPGTTSNHNPDTSGSRVVWSGFDHEGNNRAYLVNGVEVVELPVNVGFGQFPQIDGDHVTGILVDDSSFAVGVTRFNIASGHLDTFPSEFRYVGTPYISGDQMAWAVLIGDERYQLFALDSQGVPVRLTESSYKSGPYVTDSFVAWTGSDIQSGIYTFDGKTISRVANASPLSVVTDADNNSLVWLEPDGLKSAIVLATYVVPEPSSMATTSVVAVSYLLSMRTHLERRSKNARRPTQRHGTA
jgi:hypothetical protein